MPCRFASSATVATSRSASRAILALNAASNFLRDLVISVLHRLRQSRTLHTLTFGPISGVHFNQQSEMALPAGGGDDVLAFAMAFYSPDHPVYEERLVVPHTEALPRHATFERGWAALCYDGDSNCIASMERIAARASRFVRSEFSVQSTLLGQRGATD